MTALFVFGTLGFWLLMVVVTLLVAVLTECERWFAGLVCLALYVVLLQWLGDVDALGYIANHPIHSVAWFGLYFAIGTVWAVLKWALFVKGQAQRLLDAFRAWCLKHHVPFSTPIDPVAWQEFEATARRDQAIYADPRYAGVLTAPLIKDYKGRFTQWMSLWPFSVLYTLGHDAVQSICRQIYLFLAEYLQAISDRIYGGILPKPPKSPEL